MKNEIERVLANWIELALSPNGNLPGDTPPARWVAEKFLRWWSADLQSHLDDATAALARIKDRLHHHGGWEKAAELLDDCEHLAESLDSLRHVLLSKEH